MFLLGHLGTGLGLACFLSWKSPTRIHYRLVLFGAILPDLIDKPLAYVTGLDSRIWAHTFLFLFAILGLSFVPMLRGLRLVGFGVATHLLLDMIWNQPAIVWYPAYGWSVPIAPFNVDRWFGGPGGPPRRLRLFRPGRRAQLRGACCGRLAGVLRHPRTESPRARRAAR